MRARLHDITMTRDGAAILSLRCPVDEAGEIYDALHDADVEAKITKARKLRSLSANAYAWVLIGKIAEKTGIGRADVYRHSIRQVSTAYDDVIVNHAAVPKLRNAWENNGIGWVTDVLDMAGAFRTVRLYYGSSTFNTKQMTELIDFLIDEAQQYKIETMPPDELASLLGRWTDGK